MPWLPEVQALEVVKTRPCRTNENTNIDGGGMSHSFDIQEISV